jgi:hypothetical protein
MHKTVLVLVALMIMIGSIIASQAEEKQNPGGPEGGGIPGQPTTTAPKKPTTIAPSKPTTTAKCDCNSHGACASNGACTCNAEYTGSTCASCAANYYGFPNCTYCVASSSCNGNGMCASNGTCTCNAGYSGATCNTKTPD